MVNSMTTPSLRDDRRAVSANQPPAVTRSKTIDDPQVSERTILANARRICAQRYKKQPNWVLAMEAFALGSTWAWALCERIGVDPDGCTMEPVAPRNDTLLADLNALARLDFGSRP